MLQEGAHCEGKKMETTGPFFDAYAMSSANEVVLGGATEFTYLKPPLKMSPKCHDGSPRGGGGGGGLHHTMRTL